MIRAGDSNTRNAIKLSGVRNKEQLEARQNFLPLPKLTQQRTIPRRYNIFRARQLKCEIILSRDANILTNERVVANHLLAGSLLIVNIDQPC